VSSTRASQALLNRGEKNRVTRQTKANINSSRSHSIFQLIIEESKDDSYGTFKRAKLNFCDLAGSEKLSKNDTLKDAHFLELKTINLSLTTLGKVISALCKNSR
jgi:hypothetical protein